ncbi:1-acyl-sn-glycerol-3-phosphate acyltransferase [Rhodococcus sp. D2-41]|uniref:1-acyl-sn-glycerol-3-phosphate acyltransferase n=1 Tax=Speluncibacter jeojiensis TaxID=2710754 RepID=A0A9X4LXH5_9ACTN|nr:lysophospholipid acyltransferase family protein [Rhodococcus sp. D2-41]MDG3010456.1 1-acyl-sn-glycerol-3-phosphate acyltransferase [Rhodococcus sp. D2-41]MDG3014203.1 1-acyl-sn-glycerol-3-phosphate acyltransferase [Corynebacteriales bacterium D3-21]
MEPVYASVIRTAKVLFALEGLKFIRTGSENIPPTGGAVIAINHTGYMDFTYAGYAAYDVGRYIRFMAKKEVFDDKVAGPLMRAMKHIPVDRAAGADSYRAAVDDLRGGELVGVFPEATISRSFELKAFKSGAARMALEAQVPILPVTIWGSQRVWTKGFPKRLGRTNTPIFVRTGAPIEAVGTPEEITARLHERMERQLREVQDAYGSHPAGEFWVPARLGGGAPTLEEADRMDAEEAAAKAAARAARKSGER